ncbi:hypothetical protein [Acinetobacter pollinis]|uniref:DUF1289 domain-containing protein n=1 Tax=Acinetobacter pollinis TaxID=2605270 RepID=A0ABU6DPI4_9GAMM|nr:hypothetical protein [Acinetobacter pollinis]MEB5475547.1 hypothetical protein [Acinetobacter pollinis]
MKKYLTLPTALMPQKQPLKKEAKDCHHLLSSEDGRCKECGMVIDYWKHRNFYRI